MRFLFLYVLILSWPLTLFSSTHSLIPKPQKFTASVGLFILNNETRIVNNTKLASHAIHYLQRHLKQSSGYGLKTTKDLQANKIYFVLNTKKVKKSEAYTLHIGRKEIRIEARDKAGFFYAVVSLLQLMDPSIWSEHRQSKKQWKIPSCDIEDYPRFKWRGLMLDSARNFFSVVYVKKFIDRMAQHKLNRFHWHLTDDEAWRIEIKKYPKLTSIGAKRGPGTKLPFSLFPAMRGPKNKVQSGHYTQKEIKALVAYAKARCVEIIPEIDIPGHAKAALVAYPKLLVDPKDTSNYKSVQKIRNNTLNPALESSYVFLENVFKEVAALFPFAYVHVGGDEIPKGAWVKSPVVKRLMHKKGFKNLKEVQGYFFSRVDKILKKEQRKMIGWQEVANYSKTLRKDNVFMSWKSATAAKSIIKKRRATILSPVQYLYFDQRYRKGKNELGHTWSTPVSTKKTYSFKPNTSSYVKGVEACLWSETLLSEKIADYLTWPRALALAELAWTEQKGRAWNSFYRRAFGVGVQRLKRQGIHYRKVKPAR